MSFNSPFLLNPLSRAFQFDCGGAPVVLQSDEGFVRGRRAGGDESHGTRDRVAAQNEGALQDAVGRHEAQAVRRHRVHGGIQGGDPGRADGGRRSVREEIHLGPAHQVQTRSDHHFVHSEFISFATK